MVRIVRVPFLIPPNAYAQVLFPRTILVRADVAVTPALIAHGLRHVAQIEEMGLLAYWFSYVTLLFRCGYENHPMEAQARAAESNPARLAAAADLIKQWKGTP